MSWAALASNQAVSYNNLQDAVNNGVFIAKTTIPVSDQEVTKANADTYVYLNTSYSPYASKASNQLITKSNLLAKSKLYTTGNSAGTYGLLQSTDGGTNFSINTNVTGGYYPASVSASLNSANYIMVGRQGTYARPGDGRLTRNAGSTWSDLTNISTTNEDIQMTAISDSGQYMIASRTSGTVGRQNLYTSNNYGSSFTLTLNNIGLLWFSNGISMSSDGSRILIAVTVPYNAYRVYSTNYGASWSTSYLGFSALSNMAVSAMSSNGQYQLVGFARTGYGLSLSTNFGGSFYDVPYASGYTWSSVSVSSSGKYMLAFSSTGYLYQSSDYGSTWAIVNGGSHFAAGGTVKFAPNEQAVYLTVATYLSGTSDHLYISNDYGVTWSIQSIASFYFGYTIAIQNVT